VFNLFIKFYWNYRVKQHLILLLRLNKFSTSDINWLQDNFSNNKHGRKSLNTVCEVPTLKRNIYFVWNTKWFMGTCKLRNETKRNETKLTETKRNRCQTKLTETKRYNTKWNKTYFNETNSWGKTTQKLNEKNRESII
jgi:hypothetical protein